ncbi:MAG: hypothetical protein AAGI71_19270 [Bacteroidota bacterium]
MLLVSEGQHALLPKADNHTLYTHLAAMGLQVVEGFPFVQLSPWLRSGRPLLYGVRGPLLLVQ